MSEALMSSIIFTQTEKNRKKFWWVVLLKWRCSNRGQPESLRLSQGHVCSQTYCISYRAFCCEWRSKNNQLNNGVCMYFNMYKEVWR